MASLTDLPLPFRLTEDASVNITSSVLAEDSPSNPTDAVIFFGVSLVLGIACRHFLRGTRVPYTVALLIIGIGLGSLEDGTKHGLGRLGGGIRLWEQIDPDLLLAVFLPALLFESSFSMEIHQIKKCIAQMFLLAGPGVLISTFCIGSALKLSFPYDWNWKTSLLLGGLLSATDPVAVVALLKELGASKKLSTIIEGESLMNDGTAIVVYQLFFKMVFGRSFNWAQIVKFLVQVSLGAVGIGLAFGVVSVLWLGLIFNDTIIEISLTLAVSYVAYFTVNLLHRFVNFDTLASKMGTTHSCALILLMFLALSPRSQSWGWFSSSTETSSSSNENHSSNKDMISKGLVAEFSMEALNDPKAVQLLETARRKLGGSNPCWFNAYQSLFSSCSEIFAAEEKRSRLAWLLSDCFQKDTGRTSFPPCNARTAMVDCLRKLQSDEHSTYLEFYLETNSICHQLQSRAFKVQVESLVNELKESALSTEEKLETIEEKSDHLLHNSNQIQESIISIDAQTTQVGNTLNNMLDYIGNVLNHSKELNEQTRGIAASQVELLEGQGIMREKLEENMARVEESCDSLSQEIETLQDKASDVKKEMTRFGEVFSTKMQNLQGKADDIANMAGISIEKQQQLLESQTKALEGLHILTNFQSEALQESRITLQQIVGFARGQHEELMQQQEQLLQAHDRLVNNSKSMLSAQEAFESKQASMFAAIEKLFALHNAMLLESRLIKAFFYYSLLIVVLYMFTSTKQTYSVRCRLYLGLCIAFAVECAILRFTATEIEQRTQFRTIVKSLFGVYAVFQLAYSCVTYRDYEALNHKMLVTLIEKVNGIGKAEDFSWDDDDVDSEVDWLAWMDNELPDDVSTIEDPNYLLSTEQDQLPQNSSIVTSTGRRYNLRNRRN